MFWGLNNFRMKHSIFLLMIAFFTLGTKAQKIPITEQQQQLWGGYITDLKFNDNWSMWNDTHWVPNSFFILRTGITKHWKKQRIRTTAGYAHLWAYPPKPNKTFRPEHRVWGQTTWTHGERQPWGYLHRLRYEARFRGTIVDDYLLNEFNFNYRLRYLFQVRYFLDREHDNKLDWFLTASDEVLFNVGHEIQNYLRLDQNRISVGAGFQYENLTIQLAYVNQLIESNIDYSFRMNHNLQLLIFHNFKW